MHLNLELKSDFPAEFQLMDGKKSTSFQGSGLSYSISKAKNVSDLYFDMELIFEDKSRIQSVKQFSLKDFKISLEGEMP